MQDIVYIEPRQNIFVLDNHKRYFKLNKSLHARLAGLDKYLSVNHNIHLTWINNNISVKNFIKNGAHREFSGILLTSPSEETRNEIRKDNSVVPIVISDDADPGEGFNYVGPDLEEDVKKVVSEISKEGAKRICLVVSHPYSDTLTTMDYFYKYLEINKLQVLPENIIGYNKKSNSFTMSDIPALKRADLITQELFTRRHDTDIFVFLDGSPVLSVYTCLTRDKGLRIPDDFQIISFQAGRQFPHNYYHILHKLSHIDQDFQTIGEQSLKTLYEIIVGKRPLHNNKVLVPGKYSRGSSSGGITQQDNNDQLFKNRLNQYIRNNYDNPLPAAKLAETMEYSYSYFLTKFKQCFGMCLKDYANQFKLDKAARLIAETDMSLTEIFMQMGYNNEVTFLRQFKKRFDKSPLDYRKSLRQS